MSHSEGKAEVQVSHPGQVFAFSTSISSPHSHINQWCRFSIPEHIPLKPFRRDRLDRLPLPPSIMATSGKVISTHETRVETKAGGIDPFQKIQQLEKNLAFVRENHALMLKSLHEEIANLKQKNRELLFELVTGIPALPKDGSESPSDRDSPDEQQERIEKLEKEIKKLHGALKDAVKTNSSLSSQLQELKREQQPRHSSNSKVCVKSPLEQTVEEEKIVCAPRGQSPQMEEYSDTLRQIQVAATHKSGKHTGRRHRNEESRSDWSEGFGRNGNNSFQRQRRHHHHHNQSPQQQPRLPRLPLRSQQNYAHAQYEIQYRQQNASTLPALVPVVDHRLDKPRKPRVPRPPKLADQVTNG